jgi:hypothetical protein
MILQYLIPCRMLAGSLPSSTLLARFPSLSALYSPFITAIRKGDVRSYDAALATPMLEKALVKNGTYLAVERAREISLRGLLKLVYRCKDQKSRISIEDFHKALLFVGVKVDLLEAEWLVATQIAKVRRIGGGECDMSKRGEEAVADSRNCHFEGLSSRLHFSFAYDDCSISAKSISKAADDCRRLKGKEGRSSTHNPATTTINV